MTDDEGECRQHSAQDEPWSHYKCVDTFPEEMEWLKTQLKKTVPDEVQDILPSLALDFSHLKLHTIPDESHKRAENTEMSGTYGEKLVGFSAGYSDPEESKSAEAAGQLVEKFASQFFSLPQHDAERRKVFLGIQKSAAKLTGSSSGAPGPDEHFELAVGAHEYRILVGRGGEATYLAANAVGTSLILDNRSLPKVEDCVKRTVLHAEIQRRYQIKFGPNSGPPYTMAHFAHPEAAGEYSRRQEPFSTYKCPPELLPGHEQTPEIETELSLHLRWPRIEMEDTCTVDLKDAKFSYYACDLLQVANVTANPRRRLIGETRIKVSGLPKTIRNGRELCTWVKSILDYGGIEFDEVSANCKPVQCLTVPGTKERIERLLTRVILGHAIELGFWTDAVPLDPMSYFEYAMAESFPWSYRWSSSAHFNEVQVIFDKNNKLDTQEFLAQMVVNDVWLRFPPALNGRAPLEHFAQYTTGLWVPSELRRLLQPELEAFNQRPSEHRGYWLRVSDSTDLAHLRMDLIKVSGWPLANVEAAHDQLVALFAPTSYSVREADQDWLLHGFGATLLQQKLDRFREESNARFLIDVDATRMEFNIFAGEAATVQIVALIEASVVDRDLVAITATFALGQKPYFDDFYELVRCYEGYKQSDGHRTAESLPFYASTAPQTLEFHGTWQQYRMAVASLAKLRDVALEYFKQCCDGLPSPPPSTAVCPICLHPTRSDCYKLKGCGHVFCRICLNRQVLTCETSREKVPFACAACEEPFRSVDIQRLLLGYNLGYGEGFHAWWLDAEKLRSFTNARLNNLRTLADRPFFCCLTPDCDGMFEPSQWSSTVFVCGKCRRRHCRTCGLDDHGTTSCQQENALRNDASFSLLAYQEKCGLDMVRECPRRGCQAIIEKIVGCHHMHCPECSIHFCWMCYYMDDKFAEIYKHLSDVHSKWTERPFVFAEDGRLLEHPPDDEREWHAAMEAVWGI